MPSRTWYCACSAYNCLEAAGWLSPRPMRTLRGRLYRLEREFLREVVREIWSSSIQTDGQSDSSGDRTAYSSYARFMIHCEKASLLGSTSSSPTNGESMSPAISSLKSRSRAVGEM